MNLAINIIISKNPGNAIIGVIVSNSLKGLKSSKKGRYYLGLTALASTCGLRVTTEEKIDSNLAKKILKTILHGEFGGAEAFQVAGLVYSSTETKIEVPGKFLSAAVSGFLCGRFGEPQALCNDDITKKLINSVINAAVKKAISIEAEIMECDSENENIDYFAFVKDMLAKDDFKIEFEIAMENVEHKMSKLIFSYLQQKDSNILKNLSDWSKLGSVSNLPAEVLIYHEDEEIRLGALGRIDKNDHNSQIIYKSVLRNDSSKAVLAAALDSLEKTARNIPLVCSVLQKTKDSIAIQALIECYAAAPAEVTEIDTAKVAAHIINNTSENEITEQLEKIGISDGCLLKFSHLRAVIDILRNEKLYVGFNYIAKVLQSSVGILAYRKYLPYIGIN